MITVPQVRVADECWIALALLTREHGDGKSFSSREILTRIREEHAHPELRPGVQAHIHQHNVANSRPSTARYRMFYRRPDGTLRLYRPGDDVHPERAGKTHPVRAELPPKYHSLLDWYEKDYCKGVAPVIAEEDPILALRGLGKEIWAGVDADAYVNDLRSHWDATETMKLPGIGRDTSIRSSEMDKIWGRISRHQGAEFKTISHLPFTYRTDGDSGIWFFRNGRRIDRRLWRGELEEALKMCPLTKTRDVQKFQCSSYLFGLLTDSRILGDKESSSKGLE